MTTITKPEALNFLGATARILASGGGLGLVHMDKPAGEMPPLHVHATRTRASTSSAAS